MEATRLDQDTSPTIANGEATNGSTDEDPAQGTMTIDLESGVSLTKDEDEDHDGEVDTTGTQDSYSDDADSEDSSADGNKDESLPEEDATKHYPAPFYCPISGDLMLDVVVAPDGESYERAAYLEKSPKEDVRLYANRALKMIMDDAVLFDPSDNSFQAGFKRLHQMAKKAVNDYFTDTASTANPDDNESQVEDQWDALSEGYYCPITFNIVHDPVVGPDGNTYERVAVENWIRIHGTSPVTRNPMSIEEMYPNHAIRNLLETEIQKPEEQVHPDILKWKVEPAPKSSDVEYGGGTRLESNRVGSALSEDSPPRMTQQEYVQYRRGNARRQMVYNLVGLLVCILLLRFVHGPRPN